MSKRARSADELPQWKTKKSMQYKMDGRAKARADKEFNMPQLQALQTMTETQLTDYLEKRHFSDRVRATITEAVFSGHCAQDEKDQRTMHSKDRVPRSLASPNLSPAGYWDLYDATIDKDVLRLDALV